MLDYHHKAKLVLLVYRITRLPQSMYSSNIATKVYQQFICVKDTLCRISNWQSLLYQLTARWWISGIQEDSNKSKRHTNIIWKSSTRESKIKNSEFVWNQRRHHSADIKSVAWIQKTFVKYNLKSDLFLMFHFLKVLLQLFSWIPFSRACICTVRC